MAKHNVAVYGTLRVGFGANDFLDGSNYLGEDRVNGLIYHLGGCPGFKFLNPNDFKSLSPVENFVFPTVTVDLYEGVDDDMLARLDRYEGFHAEWPEDSLYLRKEVKALARGIPVFIYEYNHDCREERLIKTGDWKDAETVFTP